MDSGDTEANGLLKAVLTGAVVAVVIVKESLEEFLHVVDDALASGCIIFGVAIEFRDTSTVAVLEAVHLPATVAAVVVGVTIDKVLLRVVSESVIAVLLHGSGSEGTDGGEGPAGTALTLVLGSSRN